eukprot:270578_1
MKHSSEFPIAHHSVSVVATDQRSRGIFVGLLDYISANKRKNRARSSSFSSSRNGGYTSAVGEPVTEEEPFALVPSPTAPVISLSPGPPRPNFSRAHTDFDSDEKKRFLERPLGVRLTRPTPPKRKILREKSGALPEFYPPAAPAAQPSGPWPNPPGARPSMGARPSRGGLARPPTDRMRPQLRLPVERLPSICDARVFCPPTPMSLEIGRNRRPKHQFKGSMNFLVVGCVFKKYRYSKGHLRWIWFDDELTEIFWGKEKEKPRGSVHIREFVAIKHGCASSKTSDSAFTIHTRVRKLELRADTCAIKQKWVLAIRALLDEFSVGKQSPNGFWPHV